MSGGVADQISELERLRATSVISDSEFVALKDKLISEAIGKQSSSAVALASQTSPTTAGKLAQFFQRLELMVVILVFLGGLALFFFPLIMEGVSGPCAAVESKFYRHFLGSDGANTAALAKEYYRELPPAISCSLIYYGQFKAPGY